MHLPVHWLILLPVTSSLLHLDILLSQHYGFYSIIKYKRVVQIMQVLMCILQRMRVRLQFLTWINTAIILLLLCVPKQSHPSRFITSNIIRNGDTASLTAYLSQLTT